MNMNSPRHWTKQYTVKKLPDHHQNIHVVSKTHFNYAHMITRTHQLIFTINMYSATIDYTYSQGILVGITYVSI